MTSLQGLSLAAVRLSDVDLGLGLAHILDEAELARAATFRSPALRDTFTAGRIALRLHISALTGDSPRSLTAAYFCPTCGNRAGHGIPVYRLPSRTGHLRASLSRSGNWCLLAASLDEPLAGIGVDIENGSAADFDGFQSLAMTAQERGQLQEVPPALKARFQTRLWVRKEAVLKALGTGLAKAPSAVDVSGSTPAGLSGRPAAALWTVEDISPGAVGLPKDFAAATATWQPRDAGPE